MLSSASFIFELYTLDLAFVWTTWTLTVDISDIPSLLLSTQISMMHTKIVQFISIKLISHHISPQQSWCHRTPFLRRPKIAPTRLFTGAIPFTRVSIPSLNTVNVLYCLRSYEQAVQGVLVVDYIDIYFLVFVLFVITSLQS